MSMHPVASVNPYVVDVSSARELHETALGVPSFLTAKHWQHLDTIWIQMYRHEKVFKQAVVTHMPRFAGHGNAAGYWYDRLTCRIYLFRLLEVSRDAHGHVTKLRVVILAHSDGRRPFSSDNDGRQPFAKSGLVDILDPEANRNYIRWIPDPVDDGSDLVGNVVMGLYQ